ncbi:hypothetical protein ACHAWO_007745 [Cyclotella atomus]|uniref:DIX domain-containing protein n=1 Tax=Cyclotella atomus TaxID=382360 RepID=A0ABD3N224_9STRA
MSTIRYFLPEDGDTEESPNVFLAPKSQRAGYPPLLSQIKNAFPLPGIYHFRFKTPIIPGTDRDKNAIAVWMDCVEESEPVPTWQGAVIAKVSRVTVEDYDESFDGGGEYARAESNVSTGGYSSSRSSMSKPQSTPNFSHQSSDSLLDAFDEPTAPAAPSGNLLDAHPPAPAPPASGGSLLDMDHIAPSSTASGYNSSGANTPTPHDELLNMTAPMPGVANHQQQQQQRPAPMQGQYPMQGMNASMPQQRMGMMPPPQGMGMQQMQQQQMQQQQFNQSRGPASSSNGAGGKNAFDQFSGNSLDPLGNLKWS